MKLTLKRNKVTKTKHKEDDKLGASIFDYNPVANKLYGDLTSLLPMSRESGLILSEREDMNFMETPILVETSPKLTEYHIFRGDEVLKDQVYIALVCEALREDSNLYNRFSAIDWSDIVITRDKQDFIREIGVYLEEALNLNLDFMDYYSNSVKDFIGAREDIKKLGESNGSYNLNLAMVFILLKKGLLAIMETEGSYITGEALLLKPYNSVDTSFTNTCKRQSEEKALCIVEYYLAITNSGVNEDVYGLTKNSVKLLDTTKSSLDKVSDSFYTKFGYGSIYALIGERLK